MKTTKSILLILAMALIGSCTTQLPNVKPFETVVPTLTPKLISTLTWTPLPTLSAQDAHAKIKELLETNGGCELPCWWGMLPQHTRTVDVKEFFQKFSVYLVDTSMLNSEKGYIRLLIPQQENSDFSISLAYKGEDETLKWIWLKMEMAHKVSNAEGESWYETTWGDPQLADFSGQFSLSNILSKYGKPSEILIVTHQTALINQPLPMSTILFYPNHGFIVEYVANGTLSLSADKVTNVIGCPSLASPIFLLWSPSQKMGLADVVSLFSSEHLYSEGLPSGKYKSIEDATGMNIEEFYEAFKSNTKKCIETPSHLWPMP